MRRLQGRGADAEGTRRPRAGWELGRLLGGNSCAGGEGKLGEEGRGQRVSRQLCAIGTISPFYRWENRFQVCNSLAGGLGARVGQPWDSHPNAATPPLVRRRGDVYGEMEPTSAQGRGHWAQGSTLDLPPRLWSSTCRSSSDVLGAGSTAGVDLQVRSLGVARPSSVVYKPRMVRLSLPGLVSRTDTDSAQSLGWVLDKRSNDSSGVEQSDDRFGAETLHHSLHLWPRCDGTGSRSYRLAPSFPSRLCGFVFPPVALPKARVANSTTCHLVRGEVLFFFLTLIAAGNPEVGAAMGPGLGQPHTLHVSPPVASSCVILDTGSGGPVT